MRRGIPRAAACVSTASVSRGRPGRAVREEAADYLRRYFPPPAEGRSCEVNLEALAWIERIAPRWSAGYVLTIDYGYTRAEAMRFPAGTLMATGVTRRGTTCWRSRASATSPRT